MTDQKFPVFDSDGHVFENDDEIFEYYEGKYAGQTRFRTFGLFPGLDGWSRGIMMSHSGQARKYTHTDAKIWGEVVDALGAEGSVLFPTAGLAHGLMRDVEFAAATATAYNNWLEERYTKLDPRLHGVGLMAVQDPAEAVKELERCAKSRERFVAMMLPSRTSTGRTYGDEFFWPIYAAAQQHDMALAMHGGPSEGLGFDHWGFRPFAKVHTLEHPVPLMIQLTDIVMSGVWDAFPNVRIGFMEGGCTWVPFMMDRMDYEYGSILGIKTRALLKKRPSEYIREGENFWVGFECGERNLKYTIDAMGGSDRILYASDYPHEPSEEEILEELPEFLADPQYSDADKRNIVYNNAKRFYRID